MWLKPSHDPTALACDRQQRRVRLAESLRTATPMPPWSPLLPMPPAGPRAVPPAQPRAPQGPLLLLWRQDRLLHRPRRGRRRRSSTGCSTSSCSATASCRPATTGGARRNASLSRPSPQPPLVHRRPSFFPSITLHPTNPAISSFSRSIQSLTCVCMRIKPTTGLSRRRPGIQCSTTSAITASKLPASTLDLLPDI